MTGREAERLVWLVGQLFPSQLTEELARFGRDEFKAFEVIDVEKAVKAHRAGHEFVNWPQLLEGCRANAGARAKGEGNARREGSWCDVYRRQRPDLADKSDLEAVLRIHRGWWQKCGKGDASRRQLDHSCRAQLAVIGIDDKAAEQWAATVFEESVDYFRQVLEEVRQHAAAPDQEALPV